MRTRTAVFLNRLPRIYSQGHNRRWCMEHLALPEFLSLKDLAKERGIDIHTAYRLVKEGKITKYMENDGGDFVRVTELQLDIDDLLDLSEEDFPHTRFFKKSELTKKRILLDLQYKFFREGPTWTIVYDGKSLRGLNGKGFKFIHFLVSKHGKEFWTNELENEVHGINPDLLGNEKETQEYGLNFVKLGYSNDRQSLGDRKTLESLRKKRDEYTADLEDAQRSNDLVLIRECTDKLTEFNKKASEYLRPGGSEKMFRHETDKIKDRVTKAISRALNTIKKEDQNIYLHFHNAIKPIHSSQLSYSPDREINWQLT
jgi:hypothetical protein